MLNKKSVLLMAIYCFAYSIICSMIFSPLFERFYLLIFKPSSGCGLSGLGCSNILGFIQNSIFAYLFFLPLFIIFLVPKKQWLAWLIFIFFPFTMVLVGGRKHLLWFVIFTIAGGLIGWLIKIAVEKLKIRNFKKS